MIDQTIKSNVFKLKGRLYTLTVLQLNSPELDRFESQLNDITQQAPKMFANTPVVLDCSALSNEPLNLKGFSKILRQNGLIPVAIQGGNPSIISLAESLGLATLNASSTHDKIIAGTQSSPAILPLAPEITTTKLIASPVRSGQQVVGKGGDLIIAASVSPGAELLADGNIHVYGALRGRALAGISGDKTARIFCQSLHAELLSIAGYYRLSDAIEFHDGPCQIYLKDEHICIAPLC